MRIAAGRVAHRVLTAQALRRVRRRLPEVTDPRVSVVLVGWDPVQTRKSLDLVTAWAKRTAVTLDRVMVVWNNSGQVAPDLPGATVVAGSNEELDIGGYAEGLRAVRQTDGNDPDRVWLLCNDRLAFYEPQIPVLGALGPPAVGLARTGCLIGWVWNHGLPVRPSATVANLWVQTHCFMMGGSPKQIRRFEGSLSVAPAASVHFDNCRFVADSTITAQFLELLTKGLIVHPGRQSGWVWPGAREPDQLDVPFVNKKARSIVVEHLMAAAWCTHGAVITAEALPDVLAGYRPLAPGSAPVVQRHAHHRIWLRLRRSRSPTPAGLS